MLHGAEWRPPSGSVGLLPCLPVKQATLTGVEARHGERLPNPAGRRLLLVEVRLLFTNDYSRPTFAFAAPVRCHRAV